MKKLLVSIAILGGLAAVNPVMAQRENQGERPEYRNDRGDDRRAYNDDRHERRGRHVEGRREARWHDRHDRDRDRRGFREGRRGHCHRGGHGRGFHRG